MTDVELDRLLDGWQAPVPPPSLRVGLRDRFPRAERRRFPHPLRWVLVAAVFATLAVGMQQSSSAPFYIFERLRELVSPFFDGLRFYRLSEVLVRVRDSNPQVFVDGVPAPQPLRIMGSHIAIEIPGDGIYQVMLVAPASIEGLTQTGHVRGNVLDFQAGGRHVRIVCNQPVTDRDNPIYVRRQ
jgi:hypothetical protein